MSKTKICKVCHREREASAFPPDARRCRECGNAANRAYYHANKEKKKAANKAWYEANRERKLNTTKAWYKNNKHKYKKEWTEYRHNYDKNVRRFTRHGITKEFYLEMLKSQDYVCADCKFKPEGLYDLTIDHDHECCSGRWSCGKCIRGLVCQGCNIQRGREDKAKRIKVIEES